MADPKSHYSMAIQPQQPPSSVTGKHRILMTAPNFLRLLSILFSAASIAVMVTSNQTVSLFSLSLEAHFYYSSAFKYFFFIPTFLIWYQVVTVLLMSGCAAATAVGYVGQYGQDHMGWQPLCDHVAKFCRSTLVSILLSYFSFFSYFGLSLLEAYSSISSPFPSPH
ncbi:CASP-like protein 1F3 [Arachis ipaensis]|uniref:CASP-like protein 1F3 n=1 Tax=Arachis ipaensis TaxID=130454 RepID=UPI0007AF9001|nr:CASP-like protein 1F3 [Arachis ipaensis]